MQVTISGFSFFFFLLGTISSSLLGQSSLVGVSLGVDIINSVNHQTVPDNPSALTPVLYNVNSRIGNFSVDLTRKLELQIGGLQLSSFYSTPLCHEEECSRRNRLLYGLAPIGLSYKLKGLTTEFSGSCLSTFGWRREGWKEQFPTALQYAYIFEGQVSFPIHISKTKPTTLFLSTGYRISSEFDVLDKRERVSPDGHTVIYGGRFNPLSAGAFFSMRLLLRQIKQSSISNSTSPIKQKNRGKKKETERVIQAPKIPIIQMTIKKFLDDNGNKVIDGLEQGAIQLEIENTGTGPCLNCKIHLNTRGETKGINVDRTIPVPTVQPGKKIRLDIPFNSDRSIKDGEINFTMNFSEPNGFNPLPIELLVETRTFKSPKIEIVDFLFSGESISPNEVATLRIQIQNTGYGDAEDIEIESKVPSGVISLSGNLNQRIPYLKSGAASEVVYEFIAPRTFEFKELEIEIELTEKFKDYGSKWTGRIPFIHDVTDSNRLVQNANDSPESTYEIPRAALSQSDSQDYTITFNQVPKDVIVETVAVVPVDGKDCKGQTVSGQDIASFTEGSLLGLYNVVERRHLERVLDEQRLALSGVLYEKSAVEAGCNVGAQGIIFTEYGCLTGQETIQLKLVDCQTSELYWSATGVNATAQETLDKVRQELEGQ